MANSNVTPSYYSRFNLQLEGREVTLKDYFAYRCGFLLGNVGKYLIRYQDKNGVEDLAKALNYMTDLTKDSFWEVRCEEPDSLSLALSTMECGLVKHSTLMMSFVKLVHFYRIGARDDFSVTLHELISDIKGEQLRLGNIKEDK